MRRSKFLFLFSVNSFLLITLASGISLYQSGTNSQGRLAFVIQDYLKSSDVQFVHNNIYKDGLNGLFEDLETKYDLPEELYVSNQVELTFNKKGDITTLYSFLYGLNDDGETESFLIDYDSSKSNDLSVTLNGNVNPTFEKTMRLQPLLDAMENLPIKETVKDWDEETLGIYYAGSRSWGYNTEGILYFDEKGDTFPIETAFNEIIGYTISVYTPNNNTITPVRFVDYSPTVSPAQIGDVPTDQNMNDNETYFLTEKTGYQLFVVDAALGSRFYTLNKTTDGGNTWDVINSDPFVGQLGVSSGITFMDENLGFIGLSHSGGSYADLYRTTDGGATFEEVELPMIEVPLTDTEKYAPFDFPEMPYKESDSLFIQVNQGQDGDYNGGSKGLYQSKDNGETWTFVGEV
ncbi:hypothetical protein GLO26_10345 [Carnobacterium inhibens]|uniref:Glycosyl hydrolase n=1 Tax=Carnobacterium inhibens TaxID=147709 RepID=A0ABR7TDZ4_9LACT|nr:hypothetical protein [Carnobacterium inhibens]